MVRIMIAKSILLYIAPAAFEMSAKPTGALEKNEEMVKGDYMNSDGEQEVMGNEESGLTCMCMCYGHL